MNVILFIHILALYHGKRPKLYILCVKYDFLKLKFYSTSIEEAFEKCINLRHLQKLITLLQTFTFNRQVSIFLIQFNVFNLHFLN